MGSHAGVMLQCGSRLGVTSPCGPMPDRNDQIKRSTQAPWSRFVSRGVCGGCRYHELEVTGDGLELHYQVLQRRYKRIPYLLHTTQLFTAYCLIPTFSAWTLCFTQAAPTLRIHPQPGPYPLNHAPSTLTPQPQALDPNIPVHPKPTLLSPTPTPRPNT